ncbi:ABC transporter permease [Paenibacillus tundrae]|uniref:ABC-2 type transport system permease protein n=1 Tax=Paenibacillus tundrae TaxID=528187 RepID=A0ABT9WJN6_9BACL|nr:ABC-2 family transporter protein [Paenibacillus tundrae]MDQ0173390.1 ABC-2 type transport system permease protein [Paenibacillus tundrae]
MKHYIWLYLRMLAVNIKSQLSFKADFWIMFLSGSLSQILNIIFIFVLFNRIPTLAGWDMWEIAFMLSLFYITEGLASIFFEGTWSLPSIVNRGEFDRLLLRPIPTVIQIFTLGFGPQGVGNVLLGLTILVYSFKETAMELTPSNIVLLSFSILFGVIIRVAINLITSITSFWTKNGNPIMMASNSILEFSKYPISIYILPIKILLLLIPYSYITFIPAALFFEKEFWKYLFYLFPVVTVYIILVAKLVLKLALNKYESFGN